MFQVFFRLIHRRILSNWTVKVKAGVVFILLVWFASSGFLFFELPGKPDLGWGDALWWALVTMATVGYGDLFPVTPLGRYVVGVPTMVFGIGFLGYLISEIAGGLLESRSRRLRGMADLSLKHHILIINVPQLDVAARLLRELRADPATAQREICIVDDVLEEMPPEWIEAGVHFVKGDPTRVEVLRRAGVTEASQAIVLARNPADPRSDDQNLVTTLVLERLHPGLRTVVEVTNPEKVEQVYLAGADSVVCPSDLTTGLMVQELQDPGIRDILHDLTSDEGGHQIYFVALEGKGTYGDLVRWGLGQQASVIGLMREGRPRLACRESEPVSSEDRAVVVAGSRPQLIRLGN